MFDWWLLVGSGLAVFVCSAYFGVWLNKPATPKNYECFDAPTPGFGYCYMEDEIRAS